MAVDKKITELPVLPSDPVTSDIFLGVRDDTDYQLTGTQLLAFINAGINAGAVVSFGTGVPDNDTGKNGDIYIKTNTGQFYQRTGGGWGVKYTVPAASSGNTFSYGIGVPSDLSGNTGDSYIDTSAGVFYQKGTGTPKWVQVFSMASGPAGATGAAGAPGADGTDGNTILNGTTPPSNDLGNNGDFYINRSNRTMYGPKAAGLWGPFFSLIANAPNFKQAYNYINTDTRFVYDPVELTLIFSLSADDKLLFPFDAINGILQAEVREIIDGFTTKTRKSFDATIANDGTFYTSVSFDGVDSDLINNFQLILS